MSARPLPAASARRSGIGRRYALLALALGALAVAFTVLGRARQTPRASRPAPRENPIVEIAFTVTGGGVEPSFASVPKGARVHLAVTCRDVAIARLVLAGYQDRLVIPPLGPGDSWRGEFVADLPGEDFAWLLDGKPAGRLAVTGSHLEEGHP